MSEVIMDKTLVVTGVVAVAELATGDLIYQVSLGEYVKNTPEIINRIPPNARVNFVGNKIAVNEMIFFLKTEEVPYKVGSKWKLKIAKNGNVNLVKIK